MRLISQFLLILNLILVGCSESNTDKVKRVSPERILPIETGKDVLINYTDSGLTKARVKAPLLERYATEDKNYTEMRYGISVDFLNKNGTVESFLKAKYAIRYDREKRMIARNDVVVLNIAGDTLRTEELIWEEATQRVYSDKFVRITTKSEIIMGDGFESDITFKNPKIHKIRGIVNLK
jgi:LPS export ABC transporter protein LptC